MTFRVLFACIVLAAFGLAHFGCEVVTEDQPPLSYPPANHLVINEVFTLPASNPNSHSWIEIFNPTNVTVNLRKWSLRFTAQRILEISLLFRDSSLNVIGEATFSLPDSVGQYDVPFQSLGALPLQPNYFFTLVSSLERLRVFNSIGPGDGPTPESIPFLETSGDTVKIARDSTNLRLNIPDTVRTYIYTVFLKQSDQLVLKDSVGRVVDVVRYGGYAYTGPGSDPYPGNQSIGVVPDYESVVRYAGAYDTDNSVNDFYITRSGLRPIPHWLSQLYKR